MSCVSCGTELPSGAMFCGECGRAVGAVKVAAPAGLAVPAAVPVANGDQHPYPYDDEATGAVDHDDDVEAVVDAVDVVDAGVRAVADEDPASGEHCPQCGSAVRNDDVFCGECGFVVHSRRSGGRDTVIVEPINLSTPVDPWLPVAAEGAGADVDVDDEPAAPADAVESAAQAAPAEPFEPHVPDEPEESTPTSAGFLFDDGDDHEHTRIVPRREQGERFILQFSTGESITVFGSGLLGRNPVPEPGEFFDQFVAISDPGKSVSKTHLEFGQDGGAFWVSDRFSGNGSVVREPDVAARRCEPGKRYRMVRGSRVDIGEQFFVVS